MLQKNRQVITRNGDKMVEIPPKLGLYGMIWHDGIGVYHGLPLAFEAFIVWWGGDSLYGHPMAIIVDLVQNPITIPCCSFRTPSILLMLMYLSLFGNSSFRHSTSFLLPNLLNTGCCFRSHGLMVVTCCNML